MGFLKELKKEARTKGLWLDADQAKTLLRLLERGYATGLVPFSPKEAALFSKLVERCEELKK